MVASLTRYISLPDPRKPHTCMSRYTYEQQRRSRTARRQTRRRQPRGQEKLWCRRTAVLDGHESVHYVAAYGWKKSRAPHKKDLKQIIERRRPPIKYRIGATTTAMAASCFTWGSHLHLCARPFTLLCLVSLLCVSIGRSCFCTRSQTSFPNISGSRVCAL